MTTTDPGLTDLIAAHTLRVVELNEAARYPECNGCDWVGGLVKDHAAHLASVVEQHTNGRTAELEATIARVIEGAQMLVESFQRVERGGNHLYDASTHRCADNLALLLAEAQGPEHLRAAVEGERR